MELSSKSFEFLKYLGAGTYGKVYLVRKKYGENKHKVYAMKVSCKAKLRNNSEALRESNVLRSISHPCHPFIIELIYTFQSKTKLYMVLEYASRGSLDDILDLMDCFEEKEAAFYIKELILAIGYLHSRNILHRDIKPSNVVIDDGGHVKLTDFGSCRENFSLQSRSDSMCGTLLFMAPEILNEDGYGKDVDWWALGVTFYRMILGQYPFIDPDSDEIVNKIQEGRYYLPSGVITKEAENLIRRLLEIGVIDRLGHMGAGEVRNHSFFKGTCWFDVLHCLEIPPFMPQTNENFSIMNPLKRFFKCFHIDPLSSTKSNEINHDDVFKGFSYTQS